MLGRVVGENPVFPSRGRTHPQTPTMAEPGQAGATLCAWFPCPCSLPEFPHTLQGQGRQQPSAGSARLPDAPTGAMALSQGLGSRETLVRGADDYLHGSHEPTSGKLKEGHQHAVPVTATHPQGAGSSMCTCYTWLHSNGSSTLRPRVHGKAWRTDHTDAASARSQQRDSQPRRWGPWDFQQGQ